MLIQPQALTRCLQQKLKALYILIGQDLFLLNEAAEAIYLAWLKNIKDSEKIILTIENPTDWSLLAEKTSSYSLFSDYRLIDIRYEKKILDPSGKAFLEGYLKNINPQCLLLMRSPFLGAKQLANLIAYDSVQGVQATPLNQRAMQSWIAARLQKKALEFERGIPELMWQYTQGNMLACAQLIEKLELVQEKKSLSLDIVKEQLINQCNYQLFELSEACLSSNAEKALQILKQAYETKTEPTLLLWLLAQEIRQLIQLIELTRTTSFNEACKQLKIWSIKKVLYQEAIKQLSCNHLLHLLQFCKRVDERIKSNQIKLVWQALEQIALSLCIRKQVGHFA